MLSCDALYYPFSRCIDATVVKQYLLLFDSITFLDPVDDDGWRGKLFEDVEHEDQGYAGYRDLADAMPWLRREGVIKVRSPQGLRSLNHEVTVAATLSDLSDASWVRGADPRRYGLPSQWFGGQPCWNVFRPKLPTGVVEALSDDVGLRHHLLEQGGDKYAWQISYAAGSSVGINVHLAAAEELSLAPVTDSQLHHYLMLQKLQRSGQSAITPTGVDEVAAAVARRTVFNIIEAILPSSRLELLSLEDILRFRDDTGPLRGEFLADVARIVAGEVDPENPVQSEVVVSRVTQQLVDRARAYGAQLDGARDKLWPKLIGAVTSPASMAGTAAALAASYITGSGYVLLASAALPALGPLRAFAEWRAEKNGALRSDATSIAYLSQVNRLVGAT